MTIRNSVAEKCLEVRIAYFGNLTGAIAIRTSGSRSLAGNVNSLGKLCVANVSSNDDLVICILNLPSIVINVEVTERLVIKSNGYSLALACLKGNLGEATKLLLRSGNLAVLAGNVNLSSLRNVTCACIFNSEGNILTIHLKI